MIIRKNKIYNRREFEKILKMNGFNYDRQSGGHRIYKRSERESMAIPGHLNRMIAQRLIKVYDLKLK